MKQKTRVNLVVATSVLALAGFGGLMLYGSRVKQAEENFRLGLQYKVEEVGDMNGDRKLELSEIESIGWLSGRANSTLPREFRLSVEESQRYLQNLKQFDPRTDSAYSIWKDHPSFEKARLHGKPVSYVNY